MEQLIAIIDLKSFYASCECAARHLDPFTTPLACCDPYRGKGSVVMSVTPFLKEKYGVPNVCRKGDLPQVPGLILAQPRMSFYLELSAKVISIFLDYVAEEDLHVYSVDESFLNLGPYLSLYPSPEWLVSSIQTRIYKELGLIATAAIGPNMFLAKVALDQEGKKKSPYLARWTYDDVPTKLWSIAPLSKIWGIGRGTSSHLQRLGIRSLKQLAQSPIELLESEFGIMGRQLHDLANGVDRSNIQEHYVPKETSLTLGQTLMRDYSKKEARLLILEMVDELSHRLRCHQQKAMVVSLWIGYTDGEQFSKQRKLVAHTSSPKVLHRHIEDLFLEAPNNTMRHLSICFGKLMATEDEQLTFDWTSDEEEKERDVLNSLDTIRDVFGPNAALRCSSLLAYSTIRERHGQIGGHKR